MKYNFTIKSVLIFVVIICSIVLQIETTNAQSGSIELNPSFQEVILDAEGQHKTYSLSITNNGSTQRRLFLSTINFGALEDTGGLVFLGAKEGQYQEKYGLASWLQPNVDEVYIAPAETKRVKILIKNRDDLRPGGHYAALVVSSNDQTDELRENKVALNQALASLLLVKKRGGEIYSMQLNSYEINNGLFKFPKSADISFDNKGNVHLIPRGKLTITGPLGREVTRGIINESSGYLLPENNRSYNVMFSDTNPLLMPGKYTAEISFRYDGNDTPKTITEEFWYIGWFSTLMIVSMSVIVVSVIWVLRFHKKSDNEVKN